MVKQHFICDLHASIPPVPPESVPAFSLPAGWFYEHCPRTLTGFVQPKVDLFEDFLEELNHANQNDKALVVNSFYVADDEQQRENMTSEFYTLVRREAQEYQERAMYLIDSGCQSPSIMERWIGRIDDLKQKKQRYETLFRKELSETDAEFASLQLYSQELQIRADGIRMQRAA